MNFNVLYLPTMPTLVAIAQKFHSLALNVNGVDISTI